MLTRFEQFTSSISAIYRDVQKLERDEMEKYGLRGSFAQYLLAMRRNPAGITAAQLCEICDKDKAAVSRVLAEMENKGLVVRSGDNAYRALLSLTEAGIQAACFVEARASTAVALAGDGLSDSDRKVLYAALDSIAAKLQQICKSGIPEK